MESKVVSLSTQVVQTILHESTLVLTPPPGRFGSRTTSQLYYARWTWRIYAPSDRWYFQQDTEVSEETEFRASYYDVLSKSQFRALKTKAISIKCYRNRRGNPPVWIDLDPGVWSVALSNTQANGNFPKDRFADLCEVSADMTKLKGSIQPKKNYLGANYYTLNFDVVLLFGLTELKAQIAWKQNVSFRFLVLDASKAVR